MPCSRRLAIRLLSMSASLRLTTSAARCPVAPGCGQVRPEGRRRLWSARYDAARSSPHRGSALPPRRRAPPAACVVRAHTRSAPAGRPDRAWFHRRTASRKRSGSAPPRRCRGRPDAGFSGLPRPPRPVGSKPQSSILPRPSKAASCLTVPAVPAHGRASRHAPAIPTAHPRPRPSPAASPHDSRHCPAADSRETSSSDRNSSVACCWSSR